MGKGPKKYKKRMGYRLEPFNIRPTTFALLFTSRGYAAAFSPVCLLT